MDPIIRKQLTLSTLQDQDVNYHHTLIILLLLFILITLWCFYVDVPYQRAVYYNGIALAVVLLLIYFDMI